MENFKRTLRRHLTRLTILGLVVICGAIAIAQVHKQSNAGANHNTLPAQTLVSQQNTESSLETAEPRGAVLGLPVHNEPGRLAITDAQRLEREALSPNDFAAKGPATPRFVADGTLPNAGTADESTSAAQNDELMNDDQVTLAQATSERFSNRFDNPFPGDDSAPEDTGAEPPKFGEIEGPPSFGDAPELIGASDKPALADGPSAPADSFDAGFPDRFDTSFASSVEDDAPAPDANRFANDAVQPPPASSTNRLRQPGSAPSFDQFNGVPASSSQPSTPLTSQAQAPPLETAPPESSFGQNTFGSASFGDSPDAAGPQELPVPDVSENSLNLPSTGLPAPELNGTQSVSLSVQKTAPTQAHVGEPATFKIRVRNNSTRSVDRVVIRDQVPKGTELLKTEPPAKQASTGGIYWEIDTLQAGEEQTVSMEVLPQLEQLIGSVAEVSFAAMASAQVEVRKPMLRIEHTTTPEVLLGDTVRFSIVIENPGTGTAKDVIIEEDVPQGLSHSKGARLDYRVGDIPPGGRRRLELSLKASEAGAVANLIRARGSNGLLAEHTANLQVVAPDLKVLIEGPTTRYLERKATYTVELQNRGTAAAQNVNLRVQLPRGLQFVSTDSKGRYDASTHSIRWLLRALEPNKGAAVKLTVDPQQKGSFVLNAVATADRDLRDAKDHSLTVDGIAALLFEVADQVDPIEVGGVTTYSIQVTNQGTKEASNVEFLAQVPPGMEAIVPQGSAKYQLEGDLVRFQPIARLAAKQSATYRIQVRGRAEGDQRFKVQMTSTDTPTPVVEEESTRVYADH